MILCAKFTGTALAVNKGHAEATGREGDAVQSMGSWEGDVQEATKPSPSKTRLPTAACTSYLTGKEIIDTSKYK